ncbi:MAG: phage tail sheath C-terminal domain-containing protein [Prochloraceae cyanobacterium]|nr:phage tail sheath C-terminal domain-containing protein [Prochloraceae cyanobacterium]
MARLDYSAPGVYVEEIRRGSMPIDGVTMSVGGFIGFTQEVRAGARLFEPTLVTSWDQYLEYFATPGSEGYTSFGSYLPYAVRGWFENGGGRCWIVSIGTQLPNAKAKKNSTGEAATMTINTVGKRPSLEFKIKPEQAENGRLNIRIEPDEPRPSEDPEDEPFDTGEYFKLSVIRGDITVTETVIDADGEEQEVEAVYRHLTLNRDVAQEEGTYVETALADSSYVEVNIASERGLPLARRPADGQYEISPPPVLYNTKELAYKMYGKNNDRTGIQGLFEIDEVSMISCPDLMFTYQKGLLNLDQVHGLMEMMITKCENSSPNPSYRMVVLDIPPVRVGQNDDKPVLPEQNRPQDVARWLDYFGRRSPYAATYYPWIKVPDPAKRGQPILIPPSGHMMGIWCRTDESRGIHKAPANITPRGVIGMAYDTNFREQELLNPLGVNCIRKFPNRGIQVWGARTLVEPADTEWRYINVRRLMSYIARSVELGTQWAVFEPNDEDLWARVKRTVVNFLDRLWKEGALYGSTADEAFYVKCDAQLNTPETIKLGRLYVEVGVSPVRPAEFVVFRIGQTSTNE